MAREGERLDLTYKFTLAIGVALSGKGEALEEVREEYLGRVRELNREGHDAAARESRPVRELQRWQEQGGTQLLADLGLGGAWTAGDPDRSGGGGIA